MTTTKKGARLVGEQRESITATVTARYDQGDSIRDIAALTGRSYGFVHRVLVESGASLRSRGGPVRRPASVLGAEG